jgi:hypothetical protein
MQSSSDVEHFANLLKKAAETAEDSPLDAALEDRLNRALPPLGEEFQCIFDACREAIAAGWMCQRSAGGIRYGRVIRPASMLGRFSVDVVEMNDIVGPAHIHPRGEIDMIMPLTPEAKFDGRGAGWLVYPPGSRHAPTVTGGKALILYLLPEGSIDFATSSP